MLEKFLKTELGVFLKRPENHSKAMKSTGFFFYYYLHAFMHT